jgi:hypothetical protein
MEVFAVFLTNSLKYYFECDDAYLLRHIFSDAKIQALQEEKRANSPQPEPDALSPKSDVGDILVQAVFWACGLGQEDLAEEIQAGVIFLCLGFREAQLHEKM